MIGRLNVIDLWIIFWTRSDSKFAAFNRRAYWPYLSELIPLCRGTEDEFLCSITSLIRGIDSRMVVMIANTDAKSATAISRVDMINMSANFLPSKAVVALCGVLAFMFEGSQCLHLNEKFGSTLQAKLLRPKPLCFPQPIHSPIVNFSH